MQLRRWLFPTPSERALLYEQRLADLDAAIEIHPEAPSAYVLRGEAHLDAGFFELALQDFQKALELAEMQFETQDWGVVAQAMRDRARDGLARATTWQHRQTPTMRSGVDF